jgi:hypothetical protein
MASREFTFHSMPRLWPICLLCLLHSSLLASTPALTEQEMKNAARIDVVTVPSPGELFAAIDKKGKPNWQDYYRAPIPTTYPSRPQIALNIGGLIADGYIAVEAEDSQQVKNVGRDIVALAKALGVSEGLIARGNSIVDFAENNEWAALREELEATQNEVKLAMEEQQDEELVVLVTLGGWIRGTEIFTTWLTANPSPDSARLLRQPAIVKFLRDRLGELPEKVQEDPLIKSLSTRLAQVEELVKFARAESPAPEQVSELKELSSAMVKDIVARAQ